MNIHKINPELVDIAKKSIYIIHPPPLRFHFIDGRTAGNLLELIDCLRFCSDNTLRYHFFRMVHEKNELLPRSDISLWIHYVLGDIDLSARIYELRMIETPEKLRKKILKTCEERYNFFKDLLESLE